MRLKSSIFVSAIMRAEQSSGAFVTILHKGSEEAGAVFFVHLKSPERADFYSPAPQSLVDGAGSFDRLFELTGTDLDPSQIEAKIMAQTKFDQDCWIVEIEKPGEFNSISKVKPFDQ